MNVTHANFKKKYLMNISFILVYKKKEKETKVVLPGEELDSSNSELNHTYKIYSYPTIHCFGGRSTVAFFRNVFNRILWEILSVYL